MCNRFYNKFYRQLALILLLGLLVLPVSIPFSTLAAGPYVVNVVSDGPDSNLSDGICYDGVNGCTLRAAIQQATADGVPTTITFAAGLTGVTLAPMGVYGTLIWSGSHITLNGEGRNITLSGQNLNPGQSLLQIQGNNNTVRYLTVSYAPQDGIRVGDFTGVGAGNDNLIEYVTFLGNAASGVMVYGSGSGGRGNQIQYSQIGATAADTTCSSGNHDGIYLTQNANDTQITNNALVCNQGYGIWIAGAGGYPIGVTIRSNQIGTKGTSGMGNAAAGILVEQASGVQIQSNTIAGNLDGIWLRGASNTVIVKNTIGVIMETTALPNNNCGVLITDEAHGNHVGGTELSDRNIISGNGFSGVCLQSEAENNIVDGNYIGTDATGNIAIPNEQMGIYISSGPENIIGSGTQGVVQLISGNKENGIYIENAKGNYIGDTNFIGVDSTLINPLKNGLAGVKLVGAENTVVTPGGVAFNGGAGVALVSGEDNLIAPYSVHHNGGLAIDLGEDGPTPNDAGDGDSGANGLLNYPEITGSSGSTVWGKACNSCTVFIYEADGNPRADGGGGSRIMLTVANTSGYWVATLPSALTAWDITTVACEEPCDSTNTSEMSPQWGSPIYRVFLPLVVRR